MKKNIANTATGSHGAGAETKPIEIITIDGLHLNAKAVDVLRGIQSGAKNPDMLTDYYSFLKEAGTDPDLTDNEQIKAIVPDTWDYTELIKALAQSGAMAAGKGGEA